MTGNTDSIKLKSILMIFWFVALVMGSASALETVLYGFNSNGTDGVYPEAGLISDSAGNLYGTTNYGGANNKGTVFELVLEVGGGWTEKVLHTFDANGSDGCYPNGVILDSAGNLYGTTKNCGVYTYGMVFELIPESDGSWMETILHSFTNSGKDGAYPLAGLTLDSMGNLYGTTYNGGRNGVGTVFELTPDSSGRRWKETILHSFDGPGGADPYAGLLLDNFGNLFGTTYYGGSQNDGTVFELIPVTGGWKEKVLHTFFNSKHLDGENPQSALILDKSGNLYGTTTFGGTYGPGTAFELTPTSGGGWNETVLHNFGSDSTDGLDPYAGLTFDTAGNLYGTTQFGGDNSCAIYGCGIVFELTPSGGNWNETIVHNFSGNGIDGYNPFGTLLLDASGNLYGTTYFGGGGGCSIEGLYFGCGSVFEVIP